MIYRNWIRGKEGFSKADELLGSLGIEAGAVGCPRRFGYRSLFKAIVLLERANGVSANDLELRWDKPGGNRRAMARQHALATHRSD